MLPITSFSLEIESDMIVNDAQLVDDQKNQTLVLLKRTSPISILQMEPQDSVQEVLTILRRQERPTFLLLPRYGDAFSHLEHFVVVQRVLMQRKYAPFLCFIIPLERAQEARMADHHTMLQASSIEEGLRLLLQFSTPKTAHTISSSTGTIEKENQQMRQEDQRTKGWQRNVSSPQSTLEGVSMSKKRRYLLGMSIALLLAASAFVVQLLFFTPLSPQSRETTPAPVGALWFTSSQQLNPNLTEGYNDRIALQLHSIPRPPEGMAYYAWLLPDQGDDATVPLLLGTSQGSVNVMYTSPDHQNLLASYSGVQIIVQPKSNLPVIPHQDPTMLGWEGFVPNSPAPNTTDKNNSSLLSHLRHLLAKDPTLQANNIPGGLDIRLTQNVAKVQEWASAAQGQYHGAHTTDGDADLIHRQMLRMLDYLDGQSYVWRDVPSDSPWLVDPLAGTFGLLDRVQNQEPPAYLEHVDMHLNGLANAPGHTKEQQQIALMVDEAIHRMKTDLQHVRQDATTVAKMNAQQMRQAGTQTMLDEMANLTTQVNAGWFDPQTGGNVGGALWINSWLQQLATIPITTISKNQSDPTVMSTYRSS